MDVVSHRIDLLMYLLGQMDLVTGLDSRFDPEYRVEHVASGSILFTSGALATVMGDFISGRNHDRFTITGTRGRIHTDFLGDRKFTVEIKEDSEEFSFTQENAHHQGLFAHKY